MTGKQLRQGKEQEQKVIGRQGWNGCYLTENTPLSFKSILILI